MYLNKSLNEYLNFYYQLNTKSFEAPYLKCDENIMISTKLFIRK